MSHTSRASCRDRWLWAWAVSVAARSALSDGKRWGGRCGRGLIGASNRSAMVLRCCKGGRAGGWEVGGRDRFVCVCVGGGAQCVCGVCVGVWECGSVGVWEGVCVGGPRLLIFPLSSFFFFILASSSSSSSSSSPFFSLFFLRYEINVTLHLRPTESGDRPPVAADLDGPGVVALAAGDGGAGTGGDGAAGAVSGTFFCDRRIVFKVPTDWRKTSTNQVWREEGAGKGVKGEF